MMTVTGVELNRDGIPDVLQQPQVGYGVPVQYGCTRTVWSSSDHGKAPAPVAEYIAPGLSLCLPVVFDFSPSPIGSAWSGALNRQGMSEGSGPSHMGHENAHR